GEGGGRALGAGILAGGIAGSGGSDFVQHLFDTGEGGAEDIFAVGGVPVHEERGASDWRAGMPGATGGRGNFCAGAVGQPGLRQRKLSEASGIYKGAGGGKHASHRARDGYGRNV